jgi:hypothetical protein
MKMEKRKKVVDEEEAMEDGFVRVPASWFFSLGEDRKLENPERLYNTEANTENNSAT